MGARFGVWYPRGSLCLGGWVQTPVRKLLGCVVSGYGLPSLILGLLCVVDTFALSLLKRKRDVIMGTPLPSPSNEVHKGRASVSSALPCKCLVSSWGTGVLYLPGAERDVWV